jgi:RNA polymerase sigma factor (TIGR02999 family)
MENEPDAIAPLLEAYRDGEARALDRLLPLVYADLRRVARRQLRKWGELTIETTGLVHETYVKLASQRVLKAGDRPHFLAICARAMRQFLLNHVRDRGALKRAAAGRTVALDDVEPAFASQVEELVLVDQALARLADIDEHLVRVFECRFFAGLSEEETAEALDRPLRSTQRDWMRARAWIRELLEGR